MFIPSDLIRAPRQLLKVLQVVQASQQEDRNKKHDAAVLEDEGVRPAGHRLWQAALLLSRPCHRCA